MGKTRKPLTEGDLRALESLFSTLYEQARSDGMARIQYSALYRLVLQEWDRIGGNRMRQNAYQRIYYLTHKEQCIGYARSYQDRERERIAARQKEYYACNRDEIDAKAHARRERNRRSHAGAGAEFRDIRKTQKLTQEDVGRAIGCSAACISLWEMGKQPISSAGRVWLGQAKREMYGRDQ